ncbi:DUF2092 domain-containing protein [Streptomyces sp. NPDC001941]|uniref:LolA family protein n=1 Tax=Streptomyces sp. NPDC001941 TaxID=3154659 RepID=UPI00331D8424
MAPNDSTHLDQEGRDTDAPRRKASRYVVPVAVAGVAAATIGLVPALAASGDPDLPKISAQELIEKIAKSDVQQLSGTVKVSTDLGLPDVASLLPKGTPSAGSGASASPQSKLMELATGSHTLKVAADGPDRQKLSLQGDGSEYSLIHNGADVWAYDSAAKEAVHSKDADHAAGAQEHGKGDKGAKGDKAVPSTPKDFADAALKAAGDTTSVTVDGSARVAGRDAYQLVIKPKQSGSTVGSVKVAVDAKNGVPLKFSLLGSDGGKPIVDVGFTKVDFAKPDASAFDFKAPAGVKVVEGDALEKGAMNGKGTDRKDGEGFGGPLGELFGGGAAEQHGKGAAQGKGKGEPTVIGKGWSSVVVLDTGSPAPKGDDAPADARKFLDALGDKVNGTFGSGTVYSTRLVNALITDDGKVYVGAVTKDTLVKAANAAK